MALKNRHLIMNKVTNCLIVTDETVPAIAELLEVCLGQQSVCHQIEKHKKINPGYKQFFPQ